MKISIQPKNLPRMIFRLAKWHFFYYLFGESSPVVCVFYITDRCVMKCKMCNVWTLKENSTLPIEVFKKTIDDVSKSCCYVSFSGGEPLVLDDIIERIKYAKKKIPHVHLVTNAYLLNKEMAKKLAESKIDEIAISIDGPREIHDKIRGVTGTFDRAIKAIENLEKHAPRVKIVVNTNIASWNIDCLSEFADFVEELGVEQKFQPISNIFEKGDYNEFTKPEIEKEKIESFVKKIISKKNVINNRYFLSQIPNYFIDRKSFSPMKEKACKLPYFYVEIKPNGDLYSCGIVFNAGKPFLIKEGIKKVLGEKEFKANQKELEKCKLCNQGMYVCYLEPRMSFPVYNFIKYRILGKKLSRKYKND